MDRVPECPKCKTDALILKVPVHAPSTRYLLFYCDGCGLNIGSSQNLDAKVPAKLSPPMLEAQRAAAR